MRLYSAVATLRAVGVSIHAPGRGATRAATSSTSARGSFNSRTREGCDCTRLFATTTPYTFQFTHPGGVRQEQIDRLLGIIEFQFTHPGGVRLNSIFIQIKKRSFQFTHPGGVRRLRSRTDYQGSCFNSRTREGCDALTLGIPSEVIRVSIHAPGRGATYFVQNCLFGLRFQFTHPGGVRRGASDRYEQLERVSIHAPGRGATVPNNSEGTTPVFQFTHPGGVRLQLHSFKRFNILVSIHAPGRGATPSPSFALALVPKFQFTHPGGVRPRNVGDSFQAVKFQFTHPGGVRHNSSSWLRLRLHVSIHAPGRGATSIAS